MGVLVVVDLVVVTVAQLVAHTVASILDDMNQVGIDKCLEGAKNPRLVDGLDFVFKLGHRQGASRLVERLEHENAVSGGFDAVPRQ